MKEWAVFLILRQLLLRDVKFSPAGKARKTSEVISRLEPRITSLSVLLQGAGKGLVERSWSGLSPGGAAGGSGKGPPRFAEDNPPASSA